MLKDVDPDYSDAGIVTSGFIDTGCLIFNAALSGSLYGGIPNNRVTAFAGETGVGKTFFAMSVMQEFMKDENAQVIYFDTEFALDKTFFSNRNIDPDRVFLPTAISLQEFKTKAVKLLKSYANMEERKPMMVVLDSLGNLPSAKELEDAESGKDVRDMTKNQLIRSIFRVLTQPLGKLNVPLVLCNHVYDVIGAYVPTKEVSGGGGVKYAASSIAFLSKKKDKEDKDVVGNIIKAVMTKTRFSRENQPIEMKLSFQTGLDRYYGLLNLANKYEIIKPVSTRMEMPDGTKVWAKDINNNPQKYYTKEIMERLEDAAHKEFAFGSHEEQEETLE
jgi:RecA/RadA recombinase